MKFALIGGDGRSRRLARLLVLDGHEVSTYALGSGGCESIEKCLEGADCLVLPLTGGVPEEAEDCIPSGCVIFGKGCHELLKDEAFAVKNAALTAEGAVQQLLMDTESTTNGKKALILGFGRIGKMLLPRLRALGMDVTVAARSHEALAWAWGLGAKTVRLGRDTMPKADVIFNTVPHPILDAAELEKLAGAYIMELASPPYGFDMSLAESLGLRCRSASGLPGKYCPEAAAEIMRDTIYNVLEDLK